MCEERGSRQPIVWETKYFFTEASINIKQKAKTFLYKTKVQKKLVSKTITGTMDPRYVINP